MAKINFDDFGELIKWPQCVIVGKQITIEQAKEVLSRTDTFFEGIGGNCRKYNVALWKEIGCPIFPVNNGDYDEYAKKSRDFNNKRRELSLEYLDNSWISTCFIEGCHGWCHPDGTIHFWNNIGKWPSWEEVYQDCKLIAKEFPFVEMKVCLYNQEGNCESYYDYEKQCVGGFYISGGKVRKLKTNEYIDPHAPETYAPYNSVSSQEDYIRDKKRRIFGETAKLAGIRGVFIRNEVFFTKKEFRQYFSMFYNKMKKEQ